MIILVHPLLFIDGLLAFSNVYDWIFDDAATSVELLDYPSETYS